MKRGMVQALVGFTVAVVIALGGVGGTYAARINDGGALGKYGSTRGFTLGGGSIKGYGVGYLGGGSIKGYGGSYVGGGSIKGYGGSYLGGGSIKGYGGSYLGGGSIKGYGSGYGYDSVTGAPGIACSRGRLIVGNDGDGGDQTLGCER